MEFHPVAQTLLTFIALITGLSAVGWLLMAKPLKIAPSASLHFALANALIFVGLALTVMRTETPSYVYWFIADQCVLLGFVLMRVGMAKLFKLMVSDRQVWFGWLFFACGMLFFTPSAASAIELGILFSLAAATSLMQLSWAVYMGIQLSFGRVPALFMSLPTTLVSVFFLFRTALLIVLPVESRSFNSIDSEAAIPALWSYAILNLLANITMFGSAFARLTSKVRLLSERDQLTGLFNRRAIQRKLSTVHQSWLSEQIPYAIVLFDIDNFKNINDEFGHAQGDQALVTVSNAINMVLPESVIASRYGGEEFLLVLPNADLPFSVEIASLLKEELAQTQLLSDGKIIPLTASYGCAVITDGCSVERLILNADRAMYDVKGNGRNGIATENGLI